MTRRRARSGRAAARALTVAAGVAGAAAALGGWWWWLARRQHHWRIALAEAIPVNSAYWRQQRTREGELLYVAVGDSAAQGIGASRPGRGYVGVIARRIAGASGARVRVANLGVSGATLRTVLDVELPVLETLDPAVLTVSIGANDMADFDPVRFEREAGELFARLPRHAIVADLPSFYFLPAHRRVRAANRMLRELAERHGFELAPLHRFTDRQGLWGVSTQFAGDLFHPNDRGYRVWADAFAPAVERRLAELGLHAAPE